MKHVLILFFLLMITVDRVYSEEEGVYIEIKSIYADNFRQQHGAALGVSNVIHSGTYSSHKQAVEDGIRRGKDMSHSNFDNLNLDGAQLRVLIWNSTDYSEYAEWFFETLMRPLTLVPAEDFDVIGRLYKGNYEGTTLRNSSFRGLDMKQSVFFNAFANSAKFQNIDLSESHFNNVEMSSAIFNRLNLINAIFLEVNFINAVFLDSDLSNVEIYYSNLEHATIQNTNMHGAIIENSTLSGCIFEPSSLPDHRKLLTCFGLKYLRFENDPSALMTLRELFYRDGFREQAREITYAIESSKNEKRSGFWKYLNWLFFDFTCEYGLKPIKIFYILGCLTLLFSLVYWIPIVWSNKRSALWIVWGDTAMFSRSCSDKFLQVAASSEYPWKIISGENRSSVLKFSRIVLISLQFSLLSALYLGWRDLNLRNWISKIQIHDYEMIATGWLRMVSGFQSLISLALLVLWVYVYFGRPFE